jgi:formylglycine-generating enzyme required for sulfatase activity
MYTIGMDHKEVEEARKYFQFVSYTNTGVRKVYVQTFKIAVHPVTVREYAEYLGHRSSKQLEDYAQEMAAYLQKVREDSIGDLPIPLQAEPVPDHETILRLPVQGLSQREAIKFAKSMGARLPSAIEWEVAARGRKSVPRLETHHLKHKNWIRMWPFPVGENPTLVSDFGLQELAGGVCEWTSDVIDGKGILMGCRYQTPADRCHYCHLALQAAYNVHTRLGQAGLRVVVSD